MQRLTAEIDRICALSDRIQSSGDINHWQTALVRHRVSKCLAYYDMGSNRGRVELHSSLSAIVYRHVAPRAAIWGLRAAMPCSKTLCRTFILRC